MENMEVDSCHLNSFLENRHLVALFMAYEWKVTSAGGTLDWWFVQ